MGEEELMEDKTLADHWDWMVQESLDGESHRPCSIESALWRKTILAKDAECRRLREDNFDAALYTSPYCIKLRAALAALKEG